MYSSLMQVPYLLGINRKGHTASYGLAHRDTGMCPTRTYCGCRAFRTPATIKVYPASRQLAQHNISLSARRIRSCSLLLPVFVNLSLQDNIMYIRKI